MAAEAQDILQSEFANALIDSLPGLFFVVDAQGHVVRWNANHTSFLGYSDADMRALPSAVALFEDPDFPRTIINDATQRVRRSEFEASILHKDGTVIPCEFHIVRRRIEGKLYIVGTAYDIRERRDADRAVAQLHRQLAHAGRFATISQLATALAHELNQPIAAMSNNAAAALVEARKAGAADSVTEPLADIAELASRCGEIIRDMRAFLRRDEMRETEIDLSDAVERITRLAGKDLSARGIHLSLSLPPERLQAMGNAVHIQQVVMNLILNGAEALSEDSSITRPAISVHLHEVGGRAQIDVTDNGPGVPEAVNGDIFTPFVSSKAAGMGLGLSICRSIAEAHGGALTHRRARGQTTFSLSLPVIP